MVSYEVSEMVLVFFVKFRVGQYYHRTIFTPWIDFFMEKCIFF